MFYYLSLTLICIFAQNSTECGIQPTHIAITQNNKMQVVNVNYLFP